MSILTQVCDKMQAILRTIADASASRCGFVRRIRKFSGGAFVQTLVFGWLETPDASYTELAQTACALGVHVTRQAIEKRMTPEAAETLKSVLEIAATTQVISAQSPTLPLLNQFTGVYVQDSTTLTLPDELRPVWKGGRAKNDCEKSAMKLHLCFDVLTGAFQHFQLSDGITADSKAAAAFGPLPAGSLHLADLGYFSFDAFRKMTQAGIFWITRLKVNCKLYDEQGEPFCLYKHLKATNSDTIDQRCYVGARDRLPARLVARRCSEQVASKRRRYIRRDAKRRQTTPSKQRLRLADWDIYITNVEVAQLTVEQVIIIAGLRWQVELLFKSFKSVGKVNTFRSAKPDRILCEVYAKLIAQLIRHWIMVAAGWRCILHDPISTAKLIGRHARTLTMSFHESKAALLKTLSNIKKDLQYSDWGQHRGRKAHNL